MEWLQFHILFYFTEYNFEDIVSFLLSFKISHIFRVSWASQAVVVIHWQIWRMLSMTSCLLDHWRRLCSEQMIFLVSEPRCWQLWHSCVSSQQHFSIRLSVPSYLPGKLETKHEYIHSFYRSSNINFHCTNLKQEINTQWGLFYTWQCYLLLYYFQ